MAEFDADGNFVGNFIPPNATIMDGPFCILYRIHENDYLVTASTSDAVHRYDAAGSYLNDLVPSINFPEQVSVTPSGNLLVAGFSTPSGCYEYTSAGVYVGYYDVVTGLRGVYELPNGNILVTNSTGVYEINRSNQLISTKIAGVNGRFIYFADGGGASTDDPQEQSQIKNFPNPVKNSTTFSFSNIKPTAHTKIEIYDLKGQLINSLPVGKDQSGVVWNGTNVHSRPVSNGVYLYKLIIDDKIISNKLLLLR